MCVFSLCIRFSFADKTSSHILFICTLQYEYWMSKASTLTKWVAWLSGKCVRLVTRGLVVRCWFEPHQGPFCFIGHISTCWLQEYILVWFYKQNCILHIQSNKIKSTKLNQRHISSTRINVTYKQFSSSKHSKQVYTIQKKPQITPTLFYSFI